MNRMTACNWRIIRHMYEDWARLHGDTLENVELDERHFQALVLAAGTKRFGIRTRQDDSLRNAIGNWLYSHEYGAWRNPNRSRPYRGRNKELWAKFVAATKDYSLSQAVG